MWSGHGSVHSSPSQTVISIMAMVSFGRDQSQVSHLQRPPLRLSELPESLCLAHDAADDRKAQAITILDLRGLNDATDYFMIASGTSGAHVRGIGEAILSTLGDQGIWAHHVEGMTTGRWVLLDYVDFIIHIFHPDTRSFYRLERLWSDAPLLDVGGS